MYQTLDELEYVLMQTKKRRFTISAIFQELKVLGLIFIVLFLGTYLVTNAQLIIDNVSDHFNSKEVYGFSEEWANSAFIEIKDNKSEEIEALVQEYEWIISLEQEIAPNLDQLLQENLNSYNFSFNLLPPTNRIIIPAINLDVPLVDTNIYDYTDFDESTFDADLENGVVKYPTTPNPWEWGNAFFFGHTSQEYWKSNPYGTVFRNIPQLKKDDKIQVVRDWTLYEYKVLETRVVKPKNVNDNYVTFWDSDKEYITLMGCYPIWRTDKRMMIFAERIN